MNQLQMWRAIRDIAVRNGFELMRNYPVFELNGYVSIPSALPTIFDPGFNYALFGEQPKHTDLHFQSLTELIVPEWEWQAHITLQAYLQGLDPIKHIYEQVTKL